MRRKTRELHEAIIREQRVAPLPRVYDCTFVQKRSNNHKKFHSLEYITISAFSIVGAKEAFLEALGDRFELILVKDIREGISCRLT